MLLASAVVSACIPTTLYAQSASSGQSDANSQSAMQEIVVTAGKREQALSTVPQGISVVTGKQLDARAAKSLADFIALTPGVSLQSSGTPGYGKIEIRGISPQVVAATVATYIDDVPISSSSQIARGGLFSPDLDPSEVDRVEVLKGPQGTLYGASSLGGVIKYVLKKPSLTTTEFNTSEELSAFDNGRFGTRLRASVTTPLITDTLGVSVSGYYRHDAGYIDDVGFGGKGVNDGNSWGARGALYWKPTSNVSVNLSAQIQNTATHGYSAVDLDWKTLKPLYGWNKESRSTPEGLRTRSEIYAATFKWDTAIGSLLSSSGYTHIAPRETTDLTYNYAAPGTPIDFSTPGAALGSHVNNQFTQEVRYTSARFGPLDFIAGGFYQHAHLNDQENYTTFTTAGVPNPTAPSLGENYGRGTLDEYAGFITATVHLSDQIDFTGGYRHSHIDQHRDTVQGGYLYGIPDFSRVTDLSTSENSDTYQGGARWRPTKNLMFYVRAASGYRPGGPRSLPPAAPAGLAPYYKSDSIWSYEAGTKLSALDGRLTLDADVFRIDWSKIQTTVAYGGFFAVGNAGKARSQGGELQASFEPVRGFVLSGNAAYTDAKYREDAPEVSVVKGERVSYVPKWTATVGADYSWALNERLKAHVGGDYDYKSSIFDNLAEPYTMPGYATFNLRGGVETKAFTVNLYVKNLTNKHAIVGTSQGYYSFFNPFIVIVNEPRSYGVSFSQKF
jgi:outer membrane receptor protein involved in Fe transport